MKFFSAFTLTLFFALTSFVAARAATEPVDLGEGLTYVRVRSLGDDTSAVASAPAKALVIDLRHATASEESIAAFQSALTTRAASAQLFILVSGSTPRLLAEGLATLPPQTITLGVEKSRPAPRVVVATKPAADRAAYDAFETGTPLEKLITGKIEKDRYDEATLVQEFKNGYAAPAEPAGNATESAPKTEAPDAKESAPAPPPTDRVLQRAVHLHRALLALRR